jgi:uncharacterized small protein (DUF1192 family)
MAAASRGKAAMGLEGRKMDEEDLLPQRQKPKPKDLTLLGIAELEEYIAGLESEIARARVEIAARQRQRSGAEALFKR